MKNFLNQIISKKLSKLSLNYKLLNIILLLIIFNLILKQYSLTNQKNSSKKIYHDQRSIGNVKIIDLDQELEPFYLYNPIECRTSIKIYVHTLVCTHNRTDGVSGYFWNNGIWEQQILVNFLTYIYNNPNWLVLDIGANIGIYTLFAARMGRDVLSVEPFYDNQIRIHKSAKMENIQDRITLIGNALSDKRNERKRLNENLGNIGAQSLLPYKDVEIKNDINAKYIVETIWFDDLAGYLPKNQYGENYKEAILKIDIEMFEPFAFQHASKLFKKIRINVVFMEWMHFHKLTNNYPLVEAMIEFLFLHDLKPYDYNNNKLNRVDWKDKWPLDVIWKRDGF